MLPCNVVVEETGGQIELIPVDPVASLQAVRNKDIGAKATDVQERLKRVINCLG